MALNKDTIAALKGPIYNTWGAISDDIDFDIDNAGAVELCVDANRLAKYGTKEADALFHALCQEHGYASVHKFLCRHIELA